MWVKANTGELMMSTAAIRRDCPYTSFPSAMSDALLAEHGYVRVQVPAKPAFDPHTQDCVERPVVQIDGVWTQPWEVRPAPEHERQQRAAQLQALQTATLKVKRASDVESIRVTTTSGRVFDGDEVSQNRMARAVVALGVGGASSTRWKLADNTVATVTANELAEALLLAGAAQTEIWMR